MTREFQKNYTICNKTEAQSMPFPDVDGLLPLPPFLRYSSCCRLTQWVSGGRSAHSAAAAAAVSYQGAPAIKSAGPSDPSAPAMAGEFWINLFGSCVMEQEPQPNRCQSTCHQQTKIKTQC